MKDNPLEHQFYTVDVFTDQVFEGAQIAVIPDSQGLNEVQMQKIANEFNLSETVFVFPIAKQKSRFRMRVYSPAKEIDFAGHPIIATAYTLAATEAIELTKKHTPIFLEQKSGEILVNITQTDRHPSLIQFSLKPEAIVDRYVPPDQEIAELLSLTTKDIESKKYQPMMVSCGFPYLIVPLQTWAAVRNAKFNYQSWSNSTAPAISAQEILLFSNQTAHTTSDFHGRLVGPNIGIHDDPPIGSTMPAFTSYLCAHEHVGTGTYTFAIDRGDENNRRSLLHIEMDNKGRNQLNIRVGGSAVFVSQGTMIIPNT